MKNFGFLLYDNINLLDFSGPYEIISLVNKLSGKSLVDLHILSQNGASVTTSNGVTIKSDYSFQNHPDLNILIVPGGIGSRTELKNNTTLQFIKQQVKSVDHIVSICSGALILAAAGLLKNLKATTHHTCIELLTELEPTAKIVNTRFIDNGTILLSAAISTGIDLSFYLVEKLFGNEPADEIERHIEWRQ